jgi:hypothetical protein
LIKRAGYKNAAQARRYFEGHIAEAFALLITINSRSGESHAGGHLFLDEEVDALPDRLYARQGLVADRVFAR